MLTSFQRGKTFFFSLRLSISTAILARFRHLQTKLRVITCHRRRERRLVSFLYKFGGYGGVILGVGGGGVKTTH